MPRVYIPSGRITGEEIALQSREARYILTVLRLVPGDEVTVFDGVGNEYRTELTEDDEGGSIWLSRSGCALSGIPLPIILGQALLKGSG
jgi:16S rRNA U1498 N3-methylase RsmE